MCERYFKNDLFWLVGGLKFQNWKWNRKILFKN
jgi:hypothetical protein